MKNFFNAVLEWKSAAALIFSASVIICAIIMIFLGETMISITVLASLLIVSGIGTFLQQLAFTDNIIKKMHYSLRMIVFAIPFFLLLAANAWFFQWFIADDSTLWLLFSGIYLVVFIGGTVSFEIYFHFMGKKYDGLLGQYRKQRDLDKS